MPIASAAVAELAIAAPTASAAPVRSDHAAAQRVLGRAVAGGGVPGIPARIQDGRDAWVGSAGVAEIVRIGVSRPPECAPGVDWGYSNTPTPPGVGAASQKLSCEVAVRGMGGAVNGTRMVSADSNGDWNYPIIAFTDLLQAQFCPGTTE
ncbi:hypothetical protein ACFXGI_16660 [Streptomyces sp. NPDC059355]|uniref:hypothetical protein n=1 Tax=Streptomyces sp. NPDC059355 TaxID=3346811 RepID=UPI003697DA26